MPIKVKLTQDKYALIDHSDYKLIRNHKWRANRDHRSFYAHTTIRVAGKRKSVSMHRMLLDMASDDSREIDHINGDGLDNRRINLRIVTHSQNQRNRRPSLRTVSCYKGICWHRRDRKWQAQIRIAGHGIYLGYFTVEHDAARAYNVAAEKYFGEYARLNVIKGPNGRGERRTTQTS